MSWLNVSVCVSGYDLVSESYGRNEQPSSEGIEVVLLVHLGSLLNLKDSRDWTREPLLRCKDDDRVLEGTGKGGGGWVGGRGFNGVRPPVH